MGAIAKSRFVELATNPIAREAEAFTLKARQAMSTEQGYRYNEYGSYETVRYPPLNAEAAAAMYEQAKVYLTEQGRFNNKGFRPWEMDNQLYATLDRSEAWWGFEFEQGYVSQEARAEVLGHVWDTWDGVAFDGEGEGSWACEVTFTPQERSKFEAGTAMAAQFMNYVGSNPGLMNNTGYAMTGTHFNISHPHLQSNTTVEKMTSILNNTLRFTNRTEKSELFGRSSLYGGFYSQVAPTSERWMEGKMFRTTYDSAVFAGYLKVCSALNDVIEAVLERWEGEGSEDSYLGADNLFEMVKSGAEPNLVVVRGQAMQGRGDSTNRPFDIPVDAPVSVSYDEDCDDEDDDDCHEGYCCEECDGPYDEWEENN